MLSSLHIKNFALIEDQEITFGGGLNVLTGETGAGKSIILAAIQFLLGEKPRAEVVRSGAAEASVQGLFDLTVVPADVRESLPEIAQGEELALVRTMSQQGKSRVFINGRLASLGVLEEVTGRLVNVCSQNQHVRLLNPRYHREVLDSFGGLTEKADRLAVLFRELSARRAELEQLSTASQKAEFERVLLDERRAELVQANVAPGSRAQMEEEVKRLASGEKLLAIGQRALGLLNEEGGLLTTVQRLAAELQEIAKLDSSQGSLIQMAQDAKLQLFELERDLRHYASRVEIDESALETARDRLAEIARLERKYKTNDEGLVRLLEETERALQGLPTAQALEGLTRQIHQLEQEFSRQAEELSRQRRKAATKLEREAARGLAEVSMGSAKVAVEFTPLAQPGVAGLDAPEFLLMSNPGEPARPLRAIASGGELSRILLVLKDVLSDRTGVNVLVFDEVDTGISGSVARAVGMKLRSLARHSQVICVTHLPQVASLADHHFLVGKTVGARTVSFVRTLEHGDRIEEIAKMLAGYKVTEAARESARELLSSK